MGCSAVRVKELLEMGHLVVGVSSLDCRVNWQFTSLRVLATEWVDGLKITEQPKAVNHAHVAVGVEAFAVARPTESETCVFLSRWMLGWTSPVQSQNLRSHGSLGNTFSLHRPYPDSI